MTTREEQLARRERDLARLEHLPSAMRALPQWLLWKYLRKEGGGKPAKVPYYASGQLRGWPRGKSKDGIPSLEHPQVEQGHPLDRASLVTFEVALQRLRGGASMEGIGFAFLPGDGLIGVDIDHAVDLETGEVSELCLDVLSRCGSYAELSVSGTGVHIILAGHTPMFKDDLIGLEVYCERQYFTCTGKHWAGHPQEVAPIDPDALTYMRALVERSKQAQAAAKALEAAAIAGQTPKKPRPPTPPGGQWPERTNDFKAVNDAAMANLDDWVPVLFPSAKPRGAGYRVTSASLGRKLQEDLSITPGGIQDFGTGTGIPGAREGGKSPIDLVVEFGGRSLKDALAWLAPLVRVTLSKPRPPGKPRAVSPPAPPPDGAPAGSAEPENLPPPPSAENAPATQQGGGGNDAEAPDHDDEDAADEADSGSAGGKRKGTKRKLSDLSRSNLNTLYSDFAYQYGSEIAWDKVKLKPIRIGNLRHTFGSDAVKIWMNSAGRSVVQEEDVRFEPGVELPPHCINLFAGLPTVPVKGDCSVMMELLRHLCSTSYAPGLGPEDITDWVLRWCALPLQRLGAKLDTALVFHGPQGTGKNLFFDVVRDMYGDYGVMVGQTEIEDKYNTWLSRRMLVVGDEVVSRQEMYHVKNRLKWIVTQHTKIPIRAMHMDTRWESNHANLVFLSNESQPLALDDGDRRFMVIYTPTAERGDLYARVREFLDAGGAAIFLHFLLSIELGDFDEHSKPPLTDAKQSLIELGMKPAERFMHEWLAGFLPLPMRVCSAEQLYRAFRRWADVAGEKWPPKQSDFTEQAKKFAIERVELDKETGELLDPVLRYKVIQLKATGTPTGRTATRCWVPRGCGVPQAEDPDEQLTEGEWAAESVEEFERVVSGFLRRPVDPEAT